MSLTMSRMGSSIYCSPLFKFGRTLSNEHITYEIKSAFGEFFSSFCNVLTHVLLNFQNKYSNYKFTVNPVIHFENYVNTSYIEQNIVVQLNGTLGEYVNLSNGALSWNDDTLINPANMTILLRAFDMSMSNIINNNEFKFDSIEMMDDHAIIKRRDGNGIMYRYTIVIALIDVFGDHYILKKDCQYVKLALTQANFRIQNINKTFTGFCDILNTLKLITCAELLPTGHMSNVSLDLSVWDTICYETTELKQFTWWNHHCRHYIELFHACIDRFKECMDKNMIIVSPINKSINLLEQLKDDTDKQHQVIETFDFWLNKSSSELLPYFQSCMNSLRI